jgi:hypothetical protein
MEIPDSEGSHNMNERTSAGTTRYFVDFDYTISKADVWDHVSQSLQFHPAGSR